MVGRAVTNRAERRIEGIPSLPAFAALVPPAPMADLRAQVDAWTKPGDIVLDLNGRGGWVARAAIAQKRRAADFESTSLTRLLAEIVLRPPDLRQLDAAVQSVGAAVVDGSTARRVIDALFASTCPVCGRTVILTSLLWEPGPGATRGIRREYRCQPCRDQLGGPDLRQAEPEQGDLDLALSVGPRGPTWENLHRRFPAPRPNHRLIDQLLSLHSPRQLIGLEAVLKGIDDEPRGAPIEAALRIAFLHAVLAASKLEHGRGRFATLHIASGSARPPAARQWRERNPWFAFEEGLRLVRGFVQRLDDGAAPITARFGSDLLELEQGTASVAIGEINASSLRRLASQAERISHSGSPSRVRLALGQPPLRWTSERLAAAYHGTAWVFGAGAASMLPWERLFRPMPRLSGPAEAEELARSTGRSLALAAPALAHSGRAVVLLDTAEPQSLVAAALGGAAAGYRLVDARLNRAGTASPAVAVFVPPQGVIAPGPRTRANRPLPPLAGGIGDPGTIAGRGMFAAPEKVDDGPYRATVAAQVVTDTAIELLRARGEPATFEELLGDLLVGLDGSGQLARLARQFRPARADEGWEGWFAQPEAASPPPGSGRTGRGRAGLPTDAAAAGEAAPPEGVATADASERETAPTPEPAAPPEPPEPQPLGPIEELLSTVRAELDRSTNRRIRQIEPGQYWLASDEDRSHAAPPLTDRVEWSVFGLLSSARGLSEQAALERTEAMFHGPDKPDATLIRTCLDSYRDPAGSAESIVCADQLERRSAEHDAMIATIADVGHRMGMQVWIGRRQQTRRVDGRPLLSWLDEEESSARPPVLAWGPEGEIERVDCAWYARHRAVFLFEVEWTAMVAEPVLVRHARYPIDDKVVRFLVIPPERSELLRLKLARSALLRRAFEERNWHILKWNHLQSFAAREEVSLAELEPYVGLDALADTAGLQLPMFES
jgi:hypothetical protein